MPMLVHDYLRQVSRTSSGCARSWGNLVHICMHFDLIGSRTRGTFLSNEACGMVVHYGTTYGFRKLRLG